MCHINIVSKVGGGREGNADRFEFKSFLRSPPDSRFSINPEFPKVQNYEILRSRSHAN